MYYVQNKIAQKWYAKILKSLREIYEWEPREGICVFWVLFFHLFFKKEYIDICQCAGDVFSLHRWMALRYYMACPTMPYRPCHARTHTSFTSYTVCFHTYRGVLLNAKTKLVHGCEIDMHKYITLLPSLKVENMLLFPAIFFLWLIFSNLRKIPFKKWKEILSNQQKLAFNEKKIK